RPVGQTPRVVLPGKACARPEREVAALAAEPPDDPAAPAVDLVDGVRVPRRNEEVPIRVRVDRVDVEVVVGNRRLVWALLVRLVERNVVDAMPFEQDAAACDVDLLERALEDRSPVHANAVEDGHQRGVAARDQELVDVVDETVTRANTRDRTV